MKDYGFIGAGKMAGAIVCGMLKSGNVKPSEIACVSGADGTGEALAQKTGIHLATSVEELCADCEVLVLACKPQQLAEVAKHSSKASCNLAISILAGTSIARLRDCLPNVKDVVRVMPNMPAQISEGISCYASDVELDADALKKVQTVLASIGEFMKVDESRLDAVTALSGSGPGYLFEFAAALMQGAKEIGFTDDEAKRLVNKTILGSAMLLCASELSADELRTAVSSPGGTTLAALEVFSKADFRKTVSDALKAAKDRSAALSAL